MVVQLQKAQFHLHEGRKELLTTGNQIQFFSSFQTWSVTILALASLNEGKELR
jgi:hypothetical protein